MEGSEIVEINFHHLNCLKAQWIKSFYLCTGILLILFLSNCSERHQVYPKIGETFVTMKEEKAYYIDRMEYLKPLLVLQEEGLDQNMVRIVGQGLRLPSPNQIIQNAIDESSHISIMKAQTVYWIKQVVKNVWLPANLSDILLAVPNAADEDAFIAAWDVEGQIFQLIITNERLHLLVGKKPKPDTTVPKDRKEYAFYCASHYLNLLEPINTSEWEFRNFGGLILGHREYEYFKYWEHSLIFLTDGQSIKLSIIKTEGETSPPQHESLKISSLPWFPRDSKE
jgi:hypothetical protein